MGLTVAGGWAAIVGRRIVVEVPASSANLGAGYDCLGLALELTNRVTVEAVDGDGSVALEVTGEGAGELPATRSNRFVAGLEAALEAAMGPRPPSIGWRVAMDNRIPLSRGLGSSAAATVGGVVAGNALAGGALAGGTLALDALLRIATSIETHPDNAAAVLLGGFVVSAHLGDRVEAVRFDAPAGLRAVLFIPERRLSTEDMRRVLPAEVPLRDAVGNMGRVAIGVAGIAAGRWELLADLTVDRIHEPYRSVAYPELPRLTGAARAAGALGAFLSGAGSTVLAFVPPGADPEPVRAALAAAAAEVGLPGRSAIVAPRNHGPEVVSG
ncbi:MAG: homoserine kinase [Chloroflexota bacterium]